jgi:sugar/nucleoside kinase (ribokinase family)
MKRKGEVPSIVGRIMDVLIVGSVAYDSVVSPLGHVKDALGGSATYAGLACSFHAKRLSLEQIGLVGVVGEDFADTDRTLLANSGLDLQGIETAKGETFRWSGSYHGTMAEAQTHETHLNVFEHFEPKVPESHQNPKITFCANLHPVLQSSVLHQATPNRLSMLDSMNLWIDIARDSLIEVMQKVDLVIINDGEVRMLADDENLVRAARKVIEMIGVQTLVVKRGEHGVIAFHGPDIISLPAYPTENVVDPTGCGDTFAGTIAAHLASGNGELTRDELRHALLSATVSASFTLESFGIQGLHSMTQEMFQHRLEAFSHMLN